MASQLDDYVILKRLAPALFGDVLLCDHRPSGDRVAVKRILKSAANEQRTLVSKKRVRENVAFERQLYQRLQTLGGHKHIMAMRDEIDFDGYLYMVFDYCARGELYEIVSSADNGKLSHSQARKYLTQIATGVQFLHANGYAHRDLSLENVLVTETDDCKVCDFGLAAPANKPTTETVGKMFYMAPEVLAGQRYEPTKADVWSLGVMLFIMLLGAPPVEAANMSDARFKIIATKGVRHLIQRWGLTDSLPAHAIDLLEGMLQAEPSQRMSMDDVVTHAFVTGTTSVPRRLMPTETVKMPAAPATPTATATAAKETKVGSTFQRLFRRSSKRRIMDVSSAQTTATSSAAVAA